MRVPVLLTFLLGLSCSLLLAQDQNAPGSGNQSAIELSSKSPRVNQAYAYLLLQAKKIHAPPLRQETLDVVANPQTCIRHRAGLTLEDKERILQNLVRAGLADTQDQTTIPGG